MMHVLATGTLIGDPVRRSGKSADFATATVRISTEEGSLLASAIAFGEMAERLLDHRAGDAVSVAGRAKLTEWTGRDGAPKHGISLVVDQLASAAAARRSDAQRRRREPADAA